VITNIQTLPAGLPIRRACARVLDAVIGLLLILGIMWLFSTLTVASQADGDLTGLGLIFITAGPILYLAYEVPLVACTGQTLGKWLLGVRVCRLDGRRLGWGRSLLRCLLPAALVFAPPPPFWLLLPYLWALVARDHRGLHDRLAGSAVTPAVPMKRGLPAG